MSVVAHNLSAMNAQRRFGINTKEKAKSIEKLSSGFRINRAADDAAGLAISEKMRAQIRGLSQGVENTQHGISLCQVADGALTEVQEMLHRLTELSIKSANGTNTPEDRFCIQEEVAEILEEINRIGETTNFNTIPLFRGGETTQVGAGELTETVGDIPFSDFVLSDVDLGKTPITERSDADKLFLQAIVNNPNSSFDGKEFNLIFGNGSTSNSSFRVTDATGVCTEVLMSSLTSTNFSYDGQDSWSREFVYSSGTGADVTIRQTVRIEETSDTEKNYVISYDFTKSQDVDRLEFMFHADTAYNNNDQCEGYYIDGNRVKKYCVYSQTDSDLTAGATSAYVYAGSMPSSFSIVDVDNALSFSEKISFAVGDEPDSLSIGHYSSIDKWSYYESLNVQLGGNTERSDLGFSLYYDMSSRDSFSFKYGIVSTESDSNIEDVVTIPDKTVFKEHTDELNLWIQAGPNEGEGMYITIGEMNTTSLGLDGLQVVTFQDSGKAISAVKTALGKVSKIRSTIGAQQNRLEHAIAYGANSEENLTAAESRIRDADMATEMVWFSKNSILEQASQAMLAQANQEKQSVLKLLE